MQDKNSHSGATRLRHHSPNTQKSVRYSNLVQQITIFQPPVPCPHHCYDSLSYICMSCHYKCLCGTCLQEGHHKSHVVKSLDKGGKFVERSLNEALIRLRSKSDLLSNLKQFMKIRKSEIFQQYSEYQKIFNANFVSIAQFLEQKRKTMLEVIENYYNSVQTKLNEILNIANNESNAAIQLILLIEQHMEKYRMYPTSLCLFYESKNLMIETMVSQAGSKFQAYKSSAPQCNWLIDIDMFQQTKEKIKNMDIAVNQFQINLFSKPSVSQVKKSAKKNQISRLQAVKSQCQIGCSTPKNIESFRQVYASFKSPQKIGKKQTHSNKLSSMPVSPGKQKTPKKKSPNRAKQQQPFKKFKKNKK